MMLETPAIELWKFLKQKLKIVSDEYYKDANVIDKKIFIKKSDM